MRPRECMRKEGWLTQDPAQILPNQLVQGSGRGKPRRAGLSPGRPQGIRPTAAEIVVIARGKAAPRTRPLTRATTDQAAEPVVSRGAYSRTAVAPGAIWLGGHVASGRRAGCVQTRPRPSGSGAGADRADPASWAGPGTRLHSPAGRVRRDEHWMHLVADQAIRSGHQDPFKNGPGGPSPQPT
jgi:hypothetical protein